MLNSIFYKMKIKLKESIASYQKRPNMVDLISFALQRPMTTSKLFWNTNVLRNKSNLLWNWFNCLDIQIMFGTMWVNTRQEIDTLFPIGPVGTSKFDLGCSPNWFCYTSWVFPWGGEFLVIQLEIPKLSSTLTLI